MVGAVRIVETRGETLVQGADAWRPVGGDLLLHRDVQAEMQKGIGLAYRRRVVLVEQAVGPVEQRVIFRVGMDGLRDQLLQRLEGLVGAEFTPALNELLAELVAVLRKHGSSSLKFRPAASCRDIRRDLECYTPGTSACARRKQNNQTKTTSDGY